MAAKHHLVVALQVRCLQIVRREPPHTLLTGKLAAGPGSGSRGGFPADAVVPGPAGRFPAGGGLTFRSGPHLVATLRSMARPCPAPARGFPPAELSWCP